MTDIVMNDSPASLSKKFVGGQDARDTFHFCVFTFHFTKPRLYQESGKSPDTLAGLFFISPYQNLPFSVRSHIGHVHHQVKQSGIAHKCWNAIAARTPRGNFNVVSRMVGTNEIDSVVVGKNTRHHSGG